MPPLQRPDGGKRAGLLLCDGDAVTARNAVSCRFDASVDAIEPAGSPPVSYLEVGQ